jgi:hypothetical protein
VMLDGVQSKNATGGELLESTFFFCAPHTTPHWQW